MARKWSGRLEPVEAQLWRSHNGIEPSFLRLERVEAQLWRSHNGIEPSFLRLERVEA